MAEVKLEIYNRERILESSLNRVKRKNMLKQNVKHIMDFDRFLKINNMSILRRVKYHQILAKSSEIIGKDFKSANREDMERFVEAVGDNKDWSIATKRDYKVLIKLFYRWLAGSEEEYPPTVNWIDTRQEYSPKVKPSELLTQEDIIKVAGLTGNPRDRAFIHVLLESGCRIEEVGTLRIMDATPDKYGVLITVCGKTGRRPIRLVKSTANLIAWLNVHPNRTKEAPLWCDFRNTERCLTYHGYVKIIQVAFARAFPNEKKRHNCHLFRHSRITELSKHLSDQELKIFAGWTRGSRMVEVYSHLTGGDVADKILEINNIKQEKKENNNPPVICPRCNAPNSEDIIFCYNCYHLLKAEKMRLTEKEASGADLVNKIQSNPKAMELLKQLATIMNEN